MAAALPALMIASTAISAVGAIQSGNAAAAQAKSQAQASRYNAEIQKQNAQISRQQSSAAEDAHRRKTRQLLGRQRAAIAQSGAGMQNSADLIEQSATAAELDALNIRYEGDMRARGLLADSNLQQYQASASDMNAKAARTSGYLGAAATLTSGAGNYYRARSLSTN